MTLDDRLDTKLCRRGHAKEGHNLTNFGKCRACMKMSDTKYRDNNIVKRREQLRRSNAKILMTEARRKYNLEAHKKHVLMNPLKTKARRLLQMAVHHGSIERPTVCNSCEYENKIEAHHYDYNRAYDVLWLCKKCHEMIHHSRVGEFI